MLSVPTHMAKSTTSRNSCQLLRIPFLNEFWMATAVVQAISSWPPHTRCMPHPTTREPPARERMVPRFSMICFWHISMNSFTKLWVVPCAGGNQEKAVVLHNVDANVWVKLKFAENDAHVMSAEVNGQHEEEVARPIKQGPDCRQVHDTLWIASWVEASEDSFACLPGGIHPGSATYVIPPVVILHKGEVQCGWVNGIFSLRVTRRVVLRAGFN
eukprot:NODE_630_length_772_cov_108.919779_g565_i0.p1 GENE.NODE_630_length_772_cov_108.919779_g565_i0~~NODE_630_length_772_cov_108.919779_g565_i0.p1  ORF type:complete len:214 (+),score=32.72 NODE_630_length_772_cov_108.919779_g565_i0:130-771(+)